MTKLFAFALLLICFTAQAQFDDRFYFPKEGWQHQFDQFTAQEDVLVVGSDTLYNVLLVPERSNGITVLYFHGAGGNITYYSRFVSPMVAAGYQVYMVDFRGYGRSTGTPLHTNVASDAELVFDRIQGIAEADAHQLWVYGTSLGSQIATHVTRKHAAEVEALVLDGPMASFTDIAMAGAPDAQKAMIGQFVTSPYSAKEDIKALENTPVLVIGSQEDTSVPFAQTQLVYDNAPGPKQLWVYEGEHLEAPVKHTESFIQHLEALQGKM